jgi:hypothetical protein
VSARLALTVLVDRGDLSGAGACMARGYVGRYGWTSYHPNAPHGWSGCTVCGRVVIRGAGRWWDR